MQKTAVVEVDSLKMHHKYHKQYKVSKRYKAHNEDAASQVGDLVVIQETRPLSKTKRWKIIETIKKSNHDADALPDEVLELVK